MDEAGVEKNPLSGRGLPRVDVRGDPDVAGSLHRKVSLGRIH